MQASTLKYVTLFPIGSVVFRLRRSERQLRARDRYQRAKFT